MSSEYPRSRLPGPAVTMFDIELRLELEAEEQGRAFREETVREQRTNAHVIRREPKP